MPNMHIPNRNRYEAEKTTILLLDSLGERTGSSALLSLRTNATARATAHTIMNMDLGSPNSISSEIHSKYSRTSRMRAVRIAIPR